MSLQDSRWRVRRIRSDATLTAALRQILARESRLTADPTIVDHAAVSRLASSSSSTPFGRTGVIHKGSPPKPQVRFQGCYGYNSVQVVEGRGDVEEDTIALLTEAAWKDQSPTPKIVNPVRLHRAEYVKQSYLELPVRGWAVIWVLAGLVVATIAANPVSRLVTQVLEYEGIL